MTAKLKDILAKANNLASARGIDKVSDEDFIARVEAICLVRHIHWALSLEDNCLLSKMKKLYPQFLHRIDSKEEPEQARFLIKALRSFIYGFISIKQPIGPDTWKETLTRYESELSQLSENRFAIMSEEDLKSVNLKSLSDGELYDWCDTTYEWPMKELKHRSANSRLMQVAYLRALLAEEMERLRDAADERLLKNQLKELNEEIIPDLLNVRITSSMSVQTLSKLKTIYTLRSDLAFKSNDFNEPTYANLQCNRLHQISKALKTKYRRAKSIDEKFEILELIENIEQINSYSHSDFVLENANGLMSKYESGLTEFQHLRLK